MPHNGLGGFFAAKPLQERASFCGTLRNKAARSGRFLARSVHRAFANTLAHCRLFLKVGEFCVRCVRCVRKREFPFIFNARVSDASLDGSLFCVRILRPSVHSLSGLMFLRCGRCDNGQKRQILLGSWCHTLGKRKVWQGVASLHVRLTPPSAHSPIDNFGWGRWGQL